MILLYPAVIGLLVLSRPADAKEEWHEASSENFVLMTNASPERGESLVLTLERFRATLGQVLPEMRRWTSGRTRLYGFRDRESLEPFLPPRSNPEDSRVKGYFRAGASENVIVLDLLMPDVDGFAVIEAIDQKAYPPIILVVTGADRRVVDRLDPRRVHGVVKKPFDPCEVADVVSACADIRGQGPAETQGLDWSSGLQPAE